MLSSETIGRNYVPLAERSYPGSVRWVSLSFGKVCVVEKGRGEPVLLLHGLGAHVGRWQATIEVLAKSHRVIAYDHPGFGKSEKGGHGYTVPFYAQVLEELIAQLALQDVTLVGHSMGGAVVLQYLIDHPQEVRRAAVISPAGIRKPHRALSDILAASLLRSPLAGRILGGAVGRCAVQRTEAVLDTIYHAQHLPEDPEWTQLRRGLMQGISHLMRFSLFDQLSRIRLPLLILWGEKDRLQPAHLALQMHRQLPLARVSIIPECGHYPMLEVPDEFHQRLLDFFAEAEYIDGCQH